MEARATRKTQIIFAFQELLKTTPNRGVVSAEQFADLKVRKGDKMVDMFDAELPNIVEIVEVAAMLENWGGDKTFDYLSNVVKVRLEEIYESNTPVYFSPLIFESPLLETEQLNEKAVLAINSDKGPLTDMASCKRCGEPKVHVKMQQTRSADEGMTAVYTCPVCGFGWSEG